MLIVTLRNVTANLVLYCKTGGSIEENAPEKPLKVRNSGEKFTADYSLYFAKNLLANNRCALPDVTSIFDARTNGALVNFTPSILPSTTS